MSIIQSFPLFNIVMCLMCGVLSSVLSGRLAKRLSLVLVGVAGVMNAFVLRFVTEHGQYTYPMGHFPAPFGNEIRVGSLEALLAVFFCAIMFLSVLGGEHYIDLEVEETKENLYFTMVNLMLASLLALIYTNDMFTAYVFVEINTIAAGAMIMSRNTGHTLVAATKYMIMSLVGSGFLLLGLSMLYSVTGHLLMVDMHGQIVKLSESGQYAMPLTVSMALMSVGLAVKSALFPFHTWLADAYSYSTPASAAVLSSLVSKGYIFLLFKIFYRVFGFDFVLDHKVTNLLFVFGVAGMIIGSVVAIYQHDVRRLIAFSSVAQIGYIYMGIGLAVPMGTVAAVFHIMSHAASKSMLFIAARGLSDVSGDSKDFVDLKGAGLRNKLAGLGFCVGAFSMVGIPLFAGFTSKVYFAEAALMANGGKLAVAMVALAVSTILNAVYFIRALITIYTPKDGEETKKGAAGCRPPVSMVAALLCFILLNIFLGTWSNSIERAIEAGLDTFG